MSFEPSFNIFRTATKLLSLLDIKKIGVAEFVLSFGGGPAR